ncbi:Kelch-like ECH-associated protein 1 [Chionoecetes opilio]|uniref:Kelch-like protein diablo n=1 Tax=Chionoecetes opilio TaxID=41210 RepID=A0A8J4Y4Z4_CHIOP|nr:Kelch-like ECH-associated protein 1 [Chionoecetes opilio]
MASWHSDIEMEETGCGGRAGVGRRGNTAGAAGGGAKGCIRVRHYTGTSYRDSGEIKFCISEYKNDAFQMMLLMKSNQMLTDVKLEVGREIFHGHKIVLAAASPYFKAMFTGGLRESEKNTVRLQGVCPTVLSHLLCFMYTGEIVINEMLVCQLLPAATMFQMNHVIDACCTFLEQQLEAGNTIGIASFAQQHGCMDLYRKANTFIEQHFSEASVSMEEEFLQLSSCQLLNLIQRDELNVPDEKDVYNAVLKWVIHDEDSRQPKMEHIVQAVRCQYLSPKFLEQQMKNCKLLKKAPACREYLAKIFRDLTLHKPPMQKERTPNAPCVIYLVGGYSNRQSLDTLECYDVEEHQWTQLSRLPVARSGLGAAYFRGIFYAVGGRNILPNGNYHDSNWVDSFNPLTNTWRQRARMNFPRNRLGVAVLDGQLYAVGGANGTTCHNTVEKYEPDDDQWTLVHHMSYARMGVGVAVVNRLMYSVGGYNGEQRLNSVECYHPENNQWTLVSPIRIPRSGAGVCSLGNSIYVIGGYDGQHQLCSVEKYDTETDTWTSVAPIKTPRSAMTVSVWDGKIFVMGKFK